jgi:cytidylate kinase
MSTTAVARVRIETRIRPGSTATIAQVRRATETFVLTRKGCVDDARVGALVDGDDGDWASECGVFLRANAERVAVAEVEWFDEDRAGDGGGDGVAAGVDVVAGGARTAQPTRARRLLAWQFELVVDVYALNEDEPGEEMEDGEEIATYREWSLPSVDFEGTWESLVFDEDEVKSTLLRYASNALLFSERGVDAQLISWNRVILLHGPPGTGKTTMCKALAQKLSIRFNDVYKQSLFVEVNAHSLFSRWFSESGKLVSKLFAKIQELLEDEETMVFVLVDEVESLAAARQGAANGSEPSDAIRVVNALLTQIDALKSRPNAFVLTTSNITEAIDLAFVDRADIKCYIGPPGVRARYDILRSCVEELVRRKLIAPSASSDDVVSAYKLNDFDCRTSTDSIALGDVAEACEGLSGRALRKLPFLAYNAVGSKTTCSTAKYLQSMLTQAKRELAARQNMNSTAAA